MDFLRVVWTLGAALHPALAILALRCKATGNAPEISTRRILVCELPAWNILRGTKGVARKGV